jgi:uncharacterized membrane protein
MANTLRGRLDRTLKQLIFEMIAGAAIVIALFFFSLAAFDSLSERYNAVVASLVLGGAYLILAAATLISLLIWLRIVRRREEAAQGAAIGIAQLWQDPVVVSTGLQVLRALGSRKGSPLATVLLAGVLIAVSRVKSKSSQSASKEST